MEATPEVKNLTPEERVMKIEVIESVLENVDDETLTKIEELVQPFLTPEEAPMEPAPAETPAEPAATDQIDALQDQAQAQVDAEAQEMNELEESLIALTNLIQDIKTENAVLKDEITKLANQPSGNVVKNVDPVEGLSDFDKEVIRLKQQRNKK